MIHRFLWPIIVPVSISAWKTCAKPTGRTQVKALLRACSPGSQDGSVSVSGTLRPPCFTSAAIARARAACSARARASRRATHISLTARRTRGHQHLHQWDVLDRKSHNHPRRAHTGGHPLAPQLLVHNPCRSPSPLLKWRSKLGAMLAMRVSQLRTGRGVQVFQLRRTARARARTRKWFTRSRTRRGR